MAAATWYLPPHADDRTFSGPATIAVTPATALSLPCQLATNPCAGQTNLIACIDDFFANDGACGTGVAHGTFAHFTALPPPNNYQANCFRDDPPCDIAPKGELRYAVDINGNLLFPVGWQGVLASPRSPPRGHCSCRARVAVICQETGRAAVAIPSAGATGRA